MANIFPFGTKSANGTYATSSTGKIMPLEYVPYLGVGLRNNSSWKTTSGNGGGGGGSGSSGSSSGATNPSQGQGAPAFQWQFPQYSQTWAFTPPAPSPYNMPPAFDPKSPTGYAKDLPVKKTKNSKTALSPFSLPDLMTKYT